VNPVYVILNPAAGRGRAVRLWSGCARHLRDAHVYYNVITTRDKSDTIAGARQAVRKGAAAVIAVGGDGTVNDVVTGLMREPGGDDLPLGIVPAGTGNDLATFLSPPPFRHARMARSLLARRSRRIDVGRVNDHYFVNNFGWGIEGQIARRVAALPPALGTARYVVALLQAIGSYRAATADITIDDRRHRLSLCSLSVANAPATGGGFRLCPAARPDDGMLDVFVAAAMPPAALALALVHILLGSTRRGRHFWLARGTRIELTAATPLPAHADGNFLGNLDHIALRIVPKGLRVLC